MTEQLFCTIIFTNENIYKSLKKNFSKIPLINNIIKNSENYPLQIEWTDLCSKIDDIHKREKLQNSNENIKLSVYDILGNEIYKTGIEKNSFKINVSSWSKGLYIVKVNDRVKKLIIE